MAGIVKVNLEVPAGVSEEARESAEHVAYEAAVLTLWERQELTLREAAEELGLTYRAFMDLLAAKGIPIERGPADLKALGEARQKLGGRP